jgi:hypothetical protein
MTCPLSQVQKQIIEHYVLDDHSSPNRIEFNDQNNLALTIQELKSGEGGRALELEKGAAKSGVMKFTDLLRSYFDLFVVRKDLKTKVYKRGHREPHENTEAKKPDKEGGRLTGVPT